MEAGWKVSVHNQEQYHVETNTAFIPAVRFRVSFAWVLGRVYSMAIGGFERRRHLKAGSRLTGRGNQ